MAHQSDLHFITCEYPPKLGGVGDFTHAIATQFAASGRVVHVWCPGTSGETIESPGIVVHRELGTFTIAHLLRASALLDVFPPHKELFVQWVPHGYGYRSLNLATCLWLRRRVNRRGDRVDVMVHEPFLPFRHASLRVSLAAVVQRIMITVLLRSATRIWVSTSSWIPRLKPFVRPDAVQRWLPVPSSIPVKTDPCKVAELRRRYAPAGTVLVGHFGTYGTSISALLSPFVVAILRSRPAVSVLLVGRGSDAAREQLVRENADIAGRLHATGVASATILSHHLQACDLMIQPYPDGVSARRTSVMAALSHGLATLTTRGELTESMWARHDAVALVDAGDAEALLARACAIVDDPALRRRLGADASAMYDELFAAERTMEALRGTTGAAQAAWA